jgi:hypothetical protein
VGASLPALGADPPLVGLSPGGGLPAQFRGSVFGGYPATPAESAFEAFVRGYGLDPAGSGAHGADPDKDGFSNWTEFAFGGSPVAGDASLLQARNAGGQIIFSFLGRGQGTTYSVEQTASVGATFVPASGISSSTAVDQGGVPAGWLRREFSVPAGDTSFYRVRASEPGQN